MSKVLHASKVHPWVRAILLSMLGATPGMVEDLWAADPFTRAEGVQATRAAAGWLRLDLDQRIADQTSDPGPPSTPEPSSQTSPVQARGEESRLRYTETLEDQRRELQFLQRQGRWETPHSESPAVSRPTAPARAQGLLMQQQQTWEGERLRMRLRRGGD